MSTVLTDKKVITRKSHKCWGCGTLYGKGSEMRYQTCADEGTVNSSYWCEICDHVMEYHYDYFDLEDGITFGSIKQNDLEIWEETKMLKEKTKHD